MRNGCDGLLSLLYLSLLSTLRDDVQHLSLRVPICEPGYFRKLEQFLDCVIFAGQLAGRFRPMYRRVTRSAAHCYALSA